MEIGDAEAFVSNRVAVFLRRLIRLDFVKPIAFEVPVNCGLRTETYVPRQLW